MVHPNNHWSRTSSRVPYPRKQSHIVWFWSSPMDLNNPRHWHRRLRVSPLTGFSTSWQFIRSQDNVLLYLSFVLLVLFMGRQRTALAESVKLFWIASCCGVDHSSISVPPSPLRRLSCHLSPYIFEPGVPPCSVRTTMPCNSVCRDAVSRP